jgi:hypothetical protein
VILATESSGHKLPSSVYNTPSDAVPLASSSVGRGGTEVDRVRLLQLRDELLAERAELRETTSAVEAALVGVEKLLARTTPPETREVQVGLDAVLVEPPDRPASPSHPAPAPKDEPPRGSRAVEAILIDTGVWMSVQELAAQQLERGWGPVSDDPVSAVRAAANRLVTSKPDLFVREHGRYRYLAVGQQASLNGNGPESDQAQASTPPADQQEQTGGDWLNLPRTDAVERMLAEAGGPRLPQPGRGEWFARSPLEVSPAGSNPVRST